MAKELREPPRLPLEPEADLTGFTVVHRAMLTDTDRVAQTATRLAAEHVSIPAGQAAALARYGGSLCSEIHHHHSREDDLIWPVIEKYAGTAVDLEPLSGDHRALDPLLSRMSTLAPAFAAAPARHVGELASVARGLSDLLHEHIPQEERDIFPIIRRYIPAAVWHATEQRMVRGIPLSHVRWLIPWVERHATAAERTWITRNAPLAFRILLRLNRRRFTNLEHEAFGTTQQDENGNHI